MSTLIGGAREINWPEVTARLPYSRSAEHRRERKRIFREVDLNGNNYLSLAEVDKAVRDVLCVQDVFDCKPAVNLAFKIAKDVAPAHTKNSDDYVTRREFRLLLQLLRHLLEVFQMFDEIDTGDDRRVGLDEFKKAVPQLEAWGATIDDPAETFASIDTNGGGQILFDEFAEWAMQQGLDLEDDDDAEDEC